LPADGLRAIFDRSRYLMSQPTADDPATGQRPNRPIRVLTVDDQPLFREATRAIVARTPGFEVVGESAGGAAALRLARDVDPDMVIVDVRMAGMDGIETTRCLSAEDPTRVIVLASSADVQGISALSSGAAAVIRKHWLSPRLLRGLWMVHRRR
jgi:DNA-binding NarL/FixJ family response regulator